MSCVILSPHVPLRTRYRRRTLRPDYGGKLRQRNEQRRVRQVARRSDRMLKELRLESEAGEMCDDEEDWEFDEKYQYEQEHEYSDWDMDDLAWLQYDPCSYGDCCCSDCW
jgi:hypothetical protein